MSDLLGDVAFTAVGAGLEAASHGLDLLTSKATLYVKLLGWSLDISGSSTNEDISSLRSLVKKRNKASTKLASRAGQATNKATVTTDAANNKMSEAEMAAAMMSKGFLPMEVQYNPATLRMNSVGGRIKKFETMGNENMNSMTATDKKTSTYLTVQLVFEAISNADAFLSSDLSVNASAIKTQGASIIKNALGDGYSVKKQVEGLISLLMEKETRQVIFVWNNIFFHGELTSVNANFTMFNKLGKPIRATVEMQIQQSNGNATFASDTQYWNDAFDAAFGV